MADPFQKPSDLLSQGQEPTVEDIRRVLQDYQHLLTEQSVPLTEGNVEVFGTLREKYGPEALAWGENWEKAGEELGFEISPDLQTLINDIYAVSEREPDARKEFWALEGPAFERTVLNILEKRKSITQTGEPPSVSLVPLAVPPEEDPTKKQAKMKTGIGGLMKKVLKKGFWPLHIIRALQQGWDTLSDEQKTEITEFMNKPLHETVGLPPPPDLGIESYLRDLLGMASEEEIAGSRIQARESYDELMGTELEGGIASLPDLQEYIDFYHGTSNVWEPEGEEYPEGRPDLSFMGTGEGQQVYAPGFYGGEARGVGVDYAEMLALKYGKVPNLYKGKIPAEIVVNKFIDFNLPVSEQSQTVQDAFKNLGYEPKDPDRFAGADILEGMKRTMGEDAAIDALRKEGVVGLRYLDQYSSPQFSTQPRGGSPHNKNLYKGKSIVKPNGEALFMNEDWQRQTRDVLKYLVDENVSVEDFVLQQREEIGSKGWLSRLFSGAGQEEKFLDILEGSNVAKSPLTRNIVIWDQPLLNEIGKTIKKEMAHGGFIDKPLYERTL